MINVTQSQVHKHTGFGLGFRVQGSGIRLEFRHLCFAHVEHECEHDDEGRQHLEGLGFIYDSSLCTCHGVLAVPVPSQQFLAFRGTLGLLDGARQGFYPIYSRF